MTKLSDVRLLVAIPTKGGGEYFEREIACEETWLRASPVDYRFFSDSHLGLKPESPSIRQERMKGICKYALEREYEFVFRVDSDAYVWLYRLLESGFEQAEAWGWCVEHPAHCGECLRQVCAGTGYALGKKAMEAVIAAPFYPMRDGNWWGDMWVAHVLEKAGIRIERTARMIDGQGREGLSPAEAAFDTISIHPVTPEGMREFYFKR